MDKTIIKSNRIPTIILDQKCALIQGLNEKLAIIRCQRIVIIDLIIFHRLGIAITGFVGPFQAAKGKNL